MTSSVDASRPLLRRHTVTLVGSFSALVAGATFGGMAITGKLAFQEGVNTATMVLLRVDIGLLLLWGFFLFRARAYARVLAPWTLLLVGALAYSAQVALFYGSLFRVPVGIASLLVFSYPALTALFAWLSGQERMSGLKIVALVLTMTGVGLVLGVPATSYEPLGIGMALGAAVAQSVYVLGIGRMTDGGDPFFSVLLVMSAAAAVLSVGVLLWGDVDLLITPTAWGWSLLHCILLPLGITSYVRAVRLIGPTLTGIGDTIGPVTAVLLGAFFLREHLNLIQAFGAALVLLGTMTVPLVRIARSPEVRRSLRRQAAE